MGAAGPLAAVVYVFGLPYLILGLLVVLIGWARVHLKKHTVTQVLAGIILAFASVYIQITFIVNLFSK